MEGYLFRVHLPATQGERDGLQGGPNLVVYLQLLEVGMEVPQLNLPEAMDSPQQ